jgi:uridylate kinase
MPTKPKGKPAGKKTRAQTGGAPRYRRILIKLSGEAFQQGADSISAKVMRHMAAELSAVLELGAEVAVVVGGGNIFRGGGAGDLGVDRVTGDYMGMLATVINGMALQSSLAAAGIDSRLQTALNLEQVAAPYIREKANRHLEAGRVVIFSAGTGNPYFTTDTAAALRAAEMNADALFKATNVDAVYSADPARSKNARRYSKLSYDDALAQKLGVMDATALALCRDRRLPLHIFKMMKPGALAKIMRGGAEGTLVFA